MLEGATDSQRINFKSAGTGERAGIEVTENTAFSHDNFVNGYSKDATFKTAAKARDNADCGSKKNTTRPPAKNLTLWSWKWTFK